MRRAGCLEQDALARREFADDLADAVQIVQSDDASHLRKGVLEVGAITLRQATGHDHGPAGAGFLRLADLQNGVNGFFLCVADEAARVDDDDVRLIRRRRQAQPSDASTAIICSESTRFFCAAEADDAD